MSAAHWTRGNLLPYHLRQEALWRFTSRMTVTTPAPHIRRMLAGGYRLRPSTDSEWLARAEFPVTRDGQRFDERYTACRTAEWPGALSTEEARRAWEAIIEGRKAAA